MILTVPADELLLNVKVAPFTNVVALGSWKVWLVDPVINWYCVEATVKTVVAPAEGVLVKPTKKLFAVTLAFASRKTTELAPLDAVTPVPPLATFRVPDNVIAPDVAELGNSPVVPPLNVVTDTPLNVVH